MLTRLLVSGHVEQSVCPSFLKVYLIFQVRFVLFYAGFSSMSPGTPVDR